MQTWIKYLLIFTLIGFILGFIIGPFFYQAPECIIAPCPNNPNQMRIPISIIGAIVGAISGAIIGKIKSKK